MRKMSARPFQVVMSRGDTGEITTCCLLLVYIKGRKDRPLIESSNRKAYFGLIFVNFSPSIWTPAMSPS